MCGSFNLDMLSRIVQWICIYTSQLPLAKIHCAAPTGCMPKSKKHQPRLANSAKPSNSRAEPRSPVRNPHSIVAGHDRTYMKTIRPLISVVRLYIHARKPLAHSLCGKNIYKTYIYTHTSCEHIKHKARTTKSALQVLKSKSHTRTESLQHKKKQRINTRQQRHNKNHLHYQCLICCEAICDI